MRREFQPGRVIADRYELRQKIGVGAMGEVWSALHRTLRTEVAIKVIRARWFDDETVAKRFIREARSAARVRGPHIVEVLDHGVDGPVVFIVMERLRGRDLRQLISSAPGPFAVDDIRRILWQVMKGLGEAHEQGLIHRDIKPANLFIVPQEETWKVKLMDFGLAKPMALSEEESFELQTRQGALLGTPAYMSPERLQTGDSDLQSDLWSVAVMAFELFCGTRPFVGRSAIQLFVKITTEAPPTPSSLARVPDGVDEWFARATHADPALRFPSITEMITTLDGLLSGSDTPTRSPPIRRLLEQHQSEVEMRQRASTESNFDYPETIFDDDNPTRASFLETSIAAGLPEEDEEEEEDESPRSQVTRMEVAELQTQIQYRLMEQLREEREKNRSLIEQLASIDDNSEPSG